MEPTSTGPGECEKVTFIRIQLPETLLKKLKASPISSKRTVLRSSQGVDDRILYSYPEMSGDRETS